MSRFIIGSLINKKNIFRNPKRELLTPIEHIEKTDICITNDIPLAKNCLEKGAVAIRPNGNIYTENNIGMAVATQEIMEKLRESGKTLDGPPPFSKHDRSKFLDKMNIIVEKSKFL